MAKLTILLGIPGSGKTTRAKQMQAEDPTLVRVCRDDIRQMLFGGLYSPEKEGLVKQLQTEAIKAALQAGLNVVVDDAGSLKPETQSKFTYLADVMGADLVFDERLLGVDVQECIRRDLARPNSVGEAVIRKFAAYYLPAPQPKGDPTKPQIAIVDVDNCLADPGDRDPLAYGSAQTDWLYTAIARLISSLPGETEIAIVSGRDESGRDALVEWLDNHFITYSSKDLIFLRKVGDRRAGAEVKAEILTEILKDYFPVLAIDDDPAAIQVYKDAGIPTLTVAHTEASQRTK